MWVQRSRIGLPLVALGLVLACLGGCQRGRATVTGKVTFGSSHLTAGTVSFIASESRVGTGTINPDGTYTVNDAPVGDVTVTVSTPPAPNMPANMPKAPRGMSMPADMVPEGAAGGAGTHNIKVVPAPEKYKTPESSPLKYNVKPGNQTFDIPLAP